MKRAMLLLAALAGAGAILGLPVASAAPPASCTGLMTGGTVNGNLVAGTGCVLHGTHVTGNVSVTPTGSLTTENGAQIDGNVEIANNSGTNQICGTAIGGNLSVHNNTGTTVIGDPTPCGAGNGNTVGGNLDVHNNTGQVTVSYNVVSGNIDCHNDSPAANGVSGSNAAGGKAKGECAALTGPSVFVTVKCPKTGCTGHAENGDTSVDFTVPGGGQSGTLTIILSPPSTSCSESESDPSMVTYMAPGGYGTGNPITVNVTYTGLVFDICKNAGPGTPFLQLLHCGTEGPPLPPCISSGPTFDSEGGPTHFTLKVTSDDPSWVG